MSGKIGVGLWASDQLDDWNKVVDCVRLAKVSGQYFGDGATLKTYILNISDNKRIFRQINPEYIIVGTSARTKTTEKDIGGNKDVTTDINESLDRQVR
ncbi:hypothetical protein CHS0354_017174 [Potamilus streckersoni]|uniref:Uncharacterized protein n=1 Tax=Potamilus streckersoni TaxID=2493646 RepID=A0AAE0W6Z8_9BIVA|nr:hypothetical protein CHS0354_017174 [Potamilus streckersoni]